MNVVPSSHALVPPRERLPALARQRPAPLVAPTRIRAVEESSDLRVEVRVGYPDFMPAQRDARSGAQIALYEFVQDGNAIPRNGLHLDVFA